MVTHLAYVIDEELMARKWTLDDVMLNSGPYDDEDHWGITRLTLDMFMSIRDDVCVLMDDTVANTFAAAFDVSPAFFWTFHNNWRVAMLAGIATI